MRKDIEQTLKEFVLESFKKQEYLLISKVNERFPLQEHESEGDRKQLLDQAIKRLTAQVEAL